MQMYILKNSWTLTDDHAVFAFLDLVDDHDVDIDWDRNRMLERLVDD
jgi:hypothetical protein